jgi:hypothetical protein
MFGITSLLAESGRSNPVSTPPHLLLLYVERENLIRQHHRLGRQIETLTKQLEAELDRMPHSAQTFATDLLAHLPRAC